MTNSQPSSANSCSIVNRLGVGRRRGRRSIELGVYAVYTSRNIVSPKVRLMVEFLVDAFRMRAWPA